MRSPPVHLFPGRRRVALAGAACSALAVLAGCGSTQTAAPTVPLSRPPSTGATSTTSVVPTTLAPTTASSTPETTARPTTTTPALPVAPQASPEAAATALVSGWAAGNKIFALSVATPASVATLFAVPYQASGAVFRGCSMAFTPIVCTYGPPGGGSGAIYEINVSPTGAAWYVSSVVIED